MAWDQALYNFVATEIGYKRGPVELAHMAGTARLVAPPTANAIAEHRAKEAALIARARAQSQVLDVRAPMPTDAARSQPGPSTGHT